MGITLKKYNVAVFGANGMAGHAIFLYLKEQGHNVIGVARKKNHFYEIHNCDISDKDAARSFINANNFDFIINAIGMLNKSCDSHQSEAVYVNTYFPHFLADLTSTKKTKIIHLSTDCVFSGKTGDYKENDIHDGETFYDKTKSLGELNDNKNLTFRNSIIGPDLNINGIGLFNWLMRQNTNIDGYSKVYWNGITTITLAKAIEHSFDTMLTGVYHLVNPIGITKYELLKIFNATFKNNTIQIHKEHNISVNKRLINTRNDFDFVVDDYSSMVLEMKNWIERHNYLYTHYFKR